MLKNILSITGKPGLYKLISQGNNMLIVESLLDGKRIPTYARDKIVSLGEISMYTMGEDIALSEVLTNLGKKEEFKAVSFDPKKADNNLLSPAYLIQAGQIYEKLGKKADALKAYNEIKTKYYGSMQSMDVEKYIERVK